MQCPVCGERLRAIVRYEVEVDICPGCKGVWLERGELDKILAYAAAGGPEPTGVAAGGAPPPPPRVEDLPPPQYAPPPPQQAPAAPERSRDDDRHDRRRRDEDDDDYDRRASFDRQGRPHRRRREGWLGEIFDIFD